MRAVMLTTVDNPFNPFENFQEWYKIDMQFGYNTCALLARIAPVADVETLPESYLNALKEQCIDRWVKMFPLTYKKVVAEEPDDNEEDYIVDKDEIESSELL